MCQFSEEKVSKQDGANVDADSKGKGERFASEEDHLDCAVGLEQFKEKCSKSDLENGNITEIVT